MGRLNVIQDGYLITSADVTAGTLFMGRAFTPDRPPETALNSWPAYNTEYAWRLHRANVIVAVDSGAKRKQGVLVELQGMTYMGAGGWRIASCLQQYNDYLHFLSDVGLPLPYGVGWCLFAGGFAAGDIVTTRIEYEVLR